MSKKKNKSGFSLIEIMVASLIIAILAIGGAATLSRTGGNIRIQGNKRIAMELANQRLELAKFSNYTSIAPLVYDVDDTYSLIADTSNPNLLVLQDAIEAEVISLGGHDYTMYTKVIRHSKDYGTIGFVAEALQINVTVEYSPLTGETIELTTVFLPPEAAN